MDVVDLEIVEYLLEVIVFNKEGTIVFVANIGYLGFSGISPSGVTIRPRSTVGINVPWVSDSNESVDNT